MLLCVLVGWGYKTKIAMNFCLQCFKSCSDMLWTEKKQKEQNLRLGTPLYMGSECIAVFYGVKFHQKVTFAILIHHSSLLYGVQMNNYCLKHVFRPKLFIHTPYMRPEGCRMTIVIFWRYLTPRNTASPSDPMYRGVPDFNFCYFCPFSVYYMPLHDLKHCRQKFVFISPPYYNG